MEIKYPEVQVKLVGEDGNAFAIMSRVMAALGRAGVAQTEQETYFAEATSGDYDHLLQVTMSWVSVK